MMAQVLAAQELDFARHVVALRRAFHESPWASEIGVTLTEKFYRWKYDTPAGEAKIACVMSGTGPVSSVSAFPMTFDVPGRPPTRGWQIGDIMTSPEVRGQGLYGTCLSKLIEVLDDQLLICFPNDRSRRGIERVGFTAVADIETFIRPLLIPLGGRDLPRSDEPSASDISWPDSRPSEYLSVHKDQEYLAWRYARHPAFHYQFIAGSEGWAVTRCFRLFGTKVAIVVEFNPTGEGCAPLLKKVHRWARANGMMASFLMANWYPMKPMRFGYLFVPSLLMPKRQILYVRYPQGRTGNLPWRTQIGDWDGL
jgi:GNAT superfamily N-acetyltransferase